eukprot:823379-Rhodomonas_salina.1
MVLRQATDSKTRRSFSAGRSMHAVCGTDVQYQGRGSLSMFEPEQGKLSRLVRGVCTEAEPVCTRTLDALHEELQEEITPPANAEVRSARPVRVSYSVSGTGIAYGGLVLTGRMEVQYGLHMPGTDIAYGCPGPVPA